MFAKSGGARSASSKIHPADAGLIPAGLSRLGRRQCRDNAPLFTRKRSTSQEGARFRERRPASNAAAGSTSPCKAAAPKARRCHGCEAIDTGKARDTLRKTRVALHGQEPLMQAPPSKPHQSDYKRDEVRHSSGAESFARLPRAAATRPGPGRGFACRHAIALRDRRECPHLRAEAPRALGGRHPRLAPIP